MSPTAINRRDGTGVLVGICVGDVSRVGAGVVVCTTADSVRMSCGLKGVAVEDTSFNSGGSRGVAIKVPLEGGEAVRKQPDSRLATRINAAI